MSKYIRNRKRVYVGLGRQRGCGSPDGNHRPAACSPGVPATEKRELALGVIAVIIKIQDNTKVLLFYVMGLPYLADSILNACAL